MPRGDLALAQHASAFQTSSLIGADYGGISDQHNMVAVVAKKYVEEKHGGASEPTGPTVPRLQSSRDCKGSGAKPSGHTRRSAEAHGFPQSAHNGEDGHDWWEEADQTDDFVWRTTDVNSILGRALWPRETSKMMMVVD